MTSARIDGRLPAIGLLVAVSLTISAVLWVLPIFEMTRIASPPSGPINWEAFWFGAMYGTIAYPLTPPVLVVTALRLVQRRQISPRLKGWIHAAAIWSLIMLGIGVTS